MSILNEHVRDMARTGRDLARAIPRMTSDPRVLDAAAAHEKACGAACGIGLVPAPGTGLAAESMEIDIHAASTTVKQLRAHAKELGVVLKSSMNKQDIIEAITEHEGE